MVMAGKPYTACFFEVLRDYSDKVADFIYNGNRKHKPFSFSGILERKTKTQGKSLLDSGENTSFRVSILDEKLIPDILAAFGKALNLKTKLSLANERIIIRNINYQENSSPWVRSSLYPKLFEEAKSADRIKLRFISPTSFRSKGKQCTIPETLLIFGSLLDKWNSFSGIRFKIGFKGTVEYRMGKKFTKEEKKQISTLADFAFFAGVGYKTTMGMGQVVRIK
ncbi:MAG: hypothetical protein C4291_10400 [Candidatus Dadabacteria bacterium]